MILKGYVETSEDVRNTVRQIFTEYLKAKNLRRTAERYAILDTIYGLEGHFDIDALYKIMMNEAKFRVSRATIYNTIILLLEAKLIIKHLFRNTSQYEKSYNIDTHHHQICTVCGKVTELQNKMLREELANIKLNRFQMSHYSLYIYGVCFNCDAKTKRITNKTT